MNTSGAAMTALRVPPTRSGRAGRQGEPPKVRVHELQGRRRYQIPSYGIANDRIAELADGGVAGPRVLNEEDDDRVMLFFFFFVLSLFARAVCVSLSVF